jgi:hypothetical protein
VMSRVWHNSLVRMPSTAPGQFKILLWDDKTFSFCFAFLFCFDRRSMYPTPPD